MNDTIDKAISALDKAIAAHPSQPPTETPSGAVTPLKSRRKGITSGARRAKAKRGPTRTREAMVTHGGLSPDEVTITANGLNGVDLKVGGESAKRWPFAMECKTVERLNVWDAIKQAKGYGADWCLTITRNNDGLYAIMDFVTVCKMVKALNDNGINW